METKMEQIDVKKIMEEIRNEIKEKGYSASELSFQDVAIPKVHGIYGEDSAAGLAEGIVEASACQRVDLYYPLAGNPVKRIIKKIIRKIVGLVLIPITLEQERYNAAMVRNMQFVQKYMNYQQQEIEDLKKQVSELKSQIEDK